jgi:ubiquitin carboxyl-terminal hydrolase 48
MRFVYDQKTGKKKKLKTRIAFPHELDMTPHLSKNENVENGTKEMRYELSSVLIHKGPSAYGGHYIAQVRDELYELKIKRGY